MICVILILTLKMSDVKVILKESATYLSSFNPFSILAEQKEVWHLYKTLNPSLM